MEDSAFNKTSRYACPCKTNCLPDGFVDISSCYYGECWFFFKGIITLKEVPLEFLGLMQ